MFQKMNQSRLSSEELARVSERLAATERKRREGLYLIGVRAGTYWAKMAADQKQLERLEAAYNRRMIDTTFGAPWRAVFTAVCPDAGDDWDKAKGFWAAIGATAEHESSDWMEGFVDGALDVWEAVKAYRTSETARGSSAKDVGPQNTE